MPLLLVMVENAQPLSAQLAVTGVALSATVGSTAILHYFTGPYIHELRELPPSSSPSSNTAADSIGHKPPHSTGMEHRHFEAVRVNLFGQKRTTRFSVSDVKLGTPSTRPFVSFETTHDQQKYFLHGQLVDDKDLLSRLLQRPLSANERQTVVLQ